MPLLRISALYKYFGGLVAVNNFDMEVNAGEILGLIGPNGAGKSTVLSMVGGTLLPTKGEIVFLGKPITRHPAYRRARMGIARVFQRNALFGSMTSLENLLAGSQLHLTHRLTEVFFKSASASSHERALRDRALEILEFVGLGQAAAELAVNLPHGSQRALCVAVALATQPKLLLLDEPLTGMNAEETKAIVQIIRTLRDLKGITVIVVEHNVKAVLGLCDRAVVLNYGRKMTEGAPREVVEDPAVIEAYLGADLDVL